MGGIKCTVWVVVLSWVNEVARSLNTKMADETGLDRWSYVEVIYLGKMADD